LSLLPGLPRPPLFPYTTLFRSEERQLKRAHRRNVKALRRQQGRPLEQVVADLRRLRLAVAQDAQRSAAHQLGNRLAYDRLLSQRSEEHTSELQSQSNLVCRLLL